MRYPLVSFSSAMMIWFLFVSFLSYKILRESEILPAAIEIDATMIGDFIKEKKSAEDFLKSEKISGKIANPQDQKTDQKNTSQATDKNNFSATNTSSDLPQKKSTPLHQPLPAIPDDLRNEAFNSYAIARFYINADGYVAAVELVQPCANPRLNHLLLNSLKNWKFSQVNEGKPSTQDIRVHFKVE